MINLFMSAIVFGTVILFGALGEIITEKSGNLNLGVPGVMYLGGIAGLAVAFAYENAAANPIPIVALLLSFIAAFAAAAVGGLILSPLWARFHFSPLSQPPKGRASAPLQGSERHGRHRAA